MAATPNRIGARGRLQILLGIFFLWIFAISLRLVALQVVHFGEFTQRAAHQQQRTIDVDPSRGIIYDRKGHELAMSVAVDSVFAVPSEINDQEGASRVLGKVLGVDSREILTRMKSSHAFCWVARKIDSDQSARLHAMNIPGVYFQKEPKRFYPKNELAAQVLGYVGLDDGGLAGIERSFDSRLKGKPGKMLISLDARRKWFGRIEQEPVSGENLVLTVDEKIQYIVERELQQAMHDTHAAAGTIIVSNPHTGEILALANSPAFNPNNFHSRDLSPLKNRAVSDVYEPGSTFKLVTLSAALEEKVVKPGDKVDCQMGSVVVGGMRIHDHHPFGLLTIAQILEKSSDVGAIKVALRLGEERFDEYIRAYGFGAQTGVELPGETRGMAKPLSRWSKVSIGAMAMGQEIGVSPLQLVSMVNTIANDGIYNAPRIIAGSAESSGPEQTVVFHPARQHRVISALTAAEMKKMMESVVLFGTGKKAILDGYSIAGKTGTAQKVDPNTHAYSRSKYVASFIGFAPISNPSVTVAVILDSPVGLHEGGQVSAPVFARVAQKVLGYLNVTRDEEVKNDPRRTLLAQAAKKAPVKEDDLAESSPDRLGDSEVAGAALQAPEDAWGAAAPALPAAAESSAMPPPARMTNAALVAGARSHAGSPEILPNSSAENSHPESYKKSAAESLQPSGNAGMPVPSATPVGANGTVVLDVDGGVVAPSLLGKSVRAAIEAAQESGIEIDVIGSGIARSQNPLPGSRISEGRHIAVRFGR